MEDLTIGQRIAVKRKELGMSQIDLGEKMGVSRQSISKWESDGALPEIDKLIALSRLFGVSVGWLLGVEQDARTEEPGEHEFSDREWEIIDRLTQNEPKLPKWLMPLTAAAAAVSLCAAILAGAALWSANNRKTDLALISQAVANLTTSTGELILDQTMLESHQFLAEPSDDLSECTFTFFGYPAAYSPDETAELVIVRGAEEVQRLECEWKGGCYSASFTVSTDTGYTPTDIKKHFDNRNLVPVHQGMWEECLSDDGLTTSYGSDLEHFVGCGPYTFETWEYDSIQIYKKNEAHWNADRYNFDTIEVRIVPEMNARVELFEQGEIFTLSPDANTIESYIDDPRMTSYGSTSVTHIDINCKNPNNPISGSVNYRKAIYHAIDRELAADSIFGHMEPAGVYVNTQAGMLSESALTYRESEYGQAVTDMVESWGPYGYNPEMALDYLNKAITECGVTEDQLPIKVKYCIDEGDISWKALGEYMMEEWPVIFDGKMELEIIPYAGMSATDFKKTGDDKWDLSPNDWSRSMSRTYPHTCFYYYLESYSGRPNNYVVPEFDAQFEVCEAAKMGDYETLLKETQKLEELYLEYVIHVPMCQSVNYELFADQIVLPVKTYIPGFGWGGIFGDLAE